MRELYSDTIAIYTEHDPAGSISVAHFAWPEGRPEETYTIALSPFLSIELDKHLPVRPNSVSLYDEGVEESKDLLEHYLGIDLSSALQQTHLLGQTALTTTLSPENRLAIASLQLANPSTLQPLKALAGAMVREQTKLAS